MKVSKQRIINELQNAINQLQSINMPDEVNGQYVVDEGGYTDGGRDMEDFSINFDYWIDEEEGIDCLSVEFTVG